MDCAEVAKSDRSVRPCLRHASSGVTECIGWLCSILRPRRGATSVLTQARLIHLDIKKLARIERPSHRVTGNRRDLCKGAGWEYVHIAIDDASRIAVARITPDETKHSAIAFLQSALAYFRALGIEPQAIMSDNGACYVSKLFAVARQALRLRHLFTRPYTPRTNGKAERFYPNLSAGMGLRSYLPTLKSPRRLSPYLSPPLQTGIEPTPPSTTIPLSPNSTSP